MEFSLSPLAFWNFITIIPDLEFLSPSFFKELEIYHIHIFLFFFLSSDNYFYLFCYLLLSMTLLFLHCLCKRFCVFSLCFRKPLLSILPLYLLLGEIFGFILLFPNFPFLCIKSNNQLFPCPIKHFFILVLCIFIFSITFGFYFFHSLSVAI